MTCQFILLSSNLVASMQAINTALYSLLFGLVCLIVLEDVAVAFSGHKLSAASLIPCGFNTFQVFTRWDHSYHQAVLSQPFINYRLFMSSRSKSDANTLHPKLDFDEDFYTVLEVDQNIDHKDLKKGVLQNGLQISPRQQTFRE